jgi:pyrophosphatase PpaX
MRDAAVLFDWDGTLASTGARMLHCFRAASRSVTGRMYPATEAEEYEFWRLNGRGALDLLSDDASGRAQIDGRFGELYDGQGGPPITLFDGIPKAVQELRARGLLIGIVTAKLRRRLDTELLTLGLATAIDVAVCADDLATEKPNPEGILRALAMLGVSPGRAVMVGDSPQDISAGRAAGTATVGVAWGNLDASDLRGADRIATEPADIPELITALLDRSARPAGPSRHSAPQ